MERRELIIIVAFLAMIEIMGTDATPCRGQNFTADSGVLTSPNYPSRHDNSLNCEWNIVFNTTKSIYLFIDNVDLYRYGAYLSIYFDGMLNETVKMPKLVTGRSKTVQVKFINNHFVTRNGWTMRWRASSKVLPASPPVVSIDKCENRCDTNADCLEIDDAYLCKCKAGYNGNGKTCEDFDECADFQNYECPFASHCYNTEGSYTCRCYSGYTKNGDVCEDKDECKLGTHSCDVNAECTNRRGGYNCRCNHGYTGNGRNCVAGLQCGGQGLLCSIHATCAFNFTSDTHYCSCKPGFTGNGVTCADLDECIDDTYLCGEHAHCNNTFGSYSCTCNPGYDHYGDGATCMDTDECSEEIDNCSSDAYCINTIGSYNCTCMRGFEGDGLNCSVLPTIDHCSSGPCSALPNLICENTIIGYRCVCPPGFRTDGTDECIDVDECQSSPCNRPGASCENTVGSYICHCPAGYTGDGYNNCRDIDECVSDKDICGKHGRCRNTLGSFHCHCESGYRKYRSKCEARLTCPTNWAGCSPNGMCGYNFTTYRFYCTCKPGFSGNGYICTDLRQPCPNSDLVCSENADCVYDGESYSCSCKHGFTGNGLICTDFDECTGSNICDEETSVCRNINDGYQCDCLPGYERGRSSYDCVDIDECKFRDVRKCEGQGQTCINTAGAYHCVCGTGYRTTASGACVSEEVTTPRTTFSWFDF